jgi:transcriptional regulator with XRE-family HTH domain
MNAAQIIRLRRKTMGLSQNELAHRSGVSLPTIQNIEMGKANPALATLEALLSALNLRINIETRPANWSLLAACGAPLFSTEADDHRPSRKVDAQTLLRSLGEAALELADVNEIPDRPRKLEAIQGLLVALRDHYPSFFRRHCAPSPVIMRLLPKTTTGRLIRLRRLASDALAEYL